LAASLDDKITAEPVRRQLMNNGSNMPPAPSSPEAPTPSAADADQTRPKVKRILVVDDERVNLKVLSGFLQAFGHEVLAADSGFRALEMLDDSIDLILLDIMMPEMDGFTVAQAVRENPETAQTPIIMVTALSDRQDKLRAVQAGANDFISKPIDKTELKVRTESLLRMKASQDELKHYQQQLENMVKARTEALRRAMQNLAESQANILKAHIETILILSSAAEYKDNETAQHIKRMSWMASILAEELGMPQSEVELVHRASPMHDIGKIGVPDAILLKPGKLTPEEWVVMREHTTIGSRILENSTSDLLQAGSIIAMTHHEKWDGSGYPKGLAGEDIPLYGRISAVADVFDALTSKRPYKEAFSNEVALDIMAKGRGSHFDPAVYDAFLRRFEDFRSIQQQLADT
jgi:putative two-component system response regulator